MPRARVFLKVTLAAALLAVPIGLYHQSAQGPSGHSSPLPVAPSGLIPPDSSVVGAGPLLFEENVGQAPRGARYVARGGGLTLFAAPERIAVSAAVGERPKRAPERPGIDRPRPDTRPHALVSMEFLGANPDAASSSSEPRGAASYSAPADADGVVERRASRYERVRFEEIYPGIDLDLYGVTGGMEYDFVVKPGADASAIRLGFRNIEGVELNADGEILMQTVAGELRQSAPTVYQQDGDERTLVEARFEEDEPGVFLLALADYDRAKPLVIDPTIVFSGGFGGPGDDPFRDITADEAGNLYVAGFTTEPSWLMASASLSELLDEGPVPGQAGASYGFLLKLIQDPNGAYMMADSMMVANTQFGAVSMVGGVVCAVGSAEPSAPPPNQQVGPGGRFDARFLCVHHNDFSRSAQLGVGGASDDFGSATDASIQGQFAYAMDWSSDPRDIPGCESAGLSSDNFGGQGFNKTTVTMLVRPDVDTGRFEMEGCSGHAYLNRENVGGVSWLKYDPSGESFFVGGATNAVAIGASNTTIAGGSAQRFFRPYNIRYGLGGVSSGAFPNVGGSVNTFIGSGEIIGDFLLQGVQFFSDQARSTARVYGSRWNTTQVSSDFLFFFPFGSPSGFNYPPRIKGIGYGLFFLAGSSNSVTDFEPPLQNAPASLSSQNMFYGLSQLDLATGAVDNHWTYMAGNVTSSDQVLLGLTCGLGFTPIGCGFTTGLGFPAVGGSSSYQGGAEDGIITQIYNPFLPPNGVVMNGQFGNAGVQTPCGAVAVFGHLQNSSNSVGAPVNGAFPTLLDGYQVLVTPGGGAPMQSQPIELFGAFVNGQVNGMIPCDFPLGEAQLQIVEGADTDAPQSSNPVDLNIVPAAPQWATFNDASGQNVACLNASNSNLLVTQANPASGGDVLQCYFFGGGQSMPACGSIAPTDQLLTLNADITVTLGTTTQNPAAFIAPGLTCALDQTNFTVKMGITADELVPPSENEAGLWVQSGKGAVFAKALISAQ